MAYYVFTWYHASFLSGNRLDDDAWEILRNRVGSCHSLHVSSWPWLPFYSVKRGSETHETREFIWMLWWGTSEVSLARLVDLWCFIFNWSVWGCASPTYYWQTHRGITGKPIGYYWQAHRVFKRMPWSPQTIHFFSEVQQNFWLLFR